MSLFFITALPRSRTAWLSTFLTWNKTCVLHEPLVDCASLDDLESKIERLRREGFEHVGISDTSLPILGYERLHARWPDAKYIVVRRDPEACRRSLVNAKVPITQAQWDRVVDEFWFFRTELVDYAKSLYAVVNFYDLNDMAPALYPWVSNGDNMPVSRIQELTRMNVQVQDLPELLAKVDPNRAAKLYTNEE